MIKKYQGCLVGGAIGDALGAPIEFMDIQSIQSHYGESGVQDYVEFTDGFGEFTDDTQMTLFTAEGILRAYHRCVLRGIDGALNTIVHQSYLRWLCTQGITTNPTPATELGIDNGWLIQQSGLHKRRAPGSTCIRALMSKIAGSIANPINDSKGCGTIMRVAPVGLFFHHDSTKAFQIACELSAITHGHPSGYLSAGVLASVLAELLQGNALKQAIAQALTILKTWDNHVETLNAVERALHQFHNHNKPTVNYQQLEVLGSAWVAEEALAISLYCALSYENDFVAGVLSAVNHSGDSDSTGAITGNILGLINGIDKIPDTWMAHLRHTKIVLQVATDLYQKIQGNTYEKNEDWWEKYPGF